MGETVREVPAGDKCAEEDDQAQRSIATAPNLTDVKNWLEKLRCKGPAKRRAAVGMANGNTSTAPAKTVFVIGLGMVGIGKDDEIARQCCGS